MEWDGFTEQTTSRLKKESAAAEQRIERMTRGKGSAAANQARGMNDLQLSIAKKYANADAVTMINDAEHAQGHMKGVMGKQSNFMRPFSPANFSILTESKLGRPAGTAPIGMGLTAPAGLPSDLRYNHGEGWFACKAARRKAVLGRCGKPRIAPPLARPLYGWERLTLTHAPWRERQRPTPWRRAITPNAPRASTTGPFPLTRATTSRVISGRKSCRPSAAT